MSTGTIVPLEEYLHTSYEPDCEYVDGELVERHVGSKKHARLQIRLGAFLVRHCRKWKLEPLAEVRVLIRDRHYRVPDLCVVDQDTTDEDVLTSPPLIWIEILSPEDRPLRVQQKIREVLDFGCAWVWVIDPETLESRVYTAHSDYPPEDNTFRIPGTDIAIPLSDLDQ